MTDIEELAEDIVALVRLNNSDEDCVEQIMEMLEDFRRAVIDENL